jgi:hypothetical protein
MLKPSGITRENIQAIVDVLKSDSTPPKEETERYLQANQIYDTIQMLLGDPPSVVKSYLKHVQKLRLSEHASKLQQHLVSSVGAMLRLHSRLHDADEDGRLQISLAKMYIELGKTVIQAIRDSKEYTDDFHKTHDQKSEQPKTHRERKADDYADENKDTVNILKILGGSVVGMGALTLILNLTKSAMKNTLHTTPKNTLHTTPKNTLHTTPKPTSSKSPKTVPKRSKLLRPRKTRSSSQVSRVKRKGKKPE